MDAVKSGRSASNQEDKSNPVIRVKKTRGNKSKVGECDFDQIRRMAEQGLTETQLSYILGICRHTFQRWKKDERFLYAYESGKCKADAEVQKSFYKLCTGFTQENVSEIVKYKDSYEIIKVGKYYPPDRAACEFWLINRCADSWKRVVEGSTEKTININFAEWTKAE